MILKVARVVPAHHPQLEPVPLPKRKSIGAAGMDLCADVDEHGVYVGPGGAVAIIPTGFKFQVPMGYEGQIRSRSGLAFKHQVVVVNAPGTLDADFTGELMVGLVNHGDSGFHVSRGDRIAQLVVCPVSGMDAILVQEHEFEATERGAGGFGSTGINDKAKK